MKLNNWVVFGDKTTGEWVVEHYVGGEDPWVADSWFDTREEAEKRALLLNDLEEEYFHTDPFHLERQAESDAAMYY